MPTSSPCAAIKPVRAAATTRTWLRRLLALMLVTASPLVLAQLREAPWGPDQYNAKDFEARLDALPDELPADQIDVVVEASDEFCKPKSTKLLGISMPVPVAPAATFFCQKMAAYLDGYAGKLPVRLSRQIWTQRKVADHVAALDLPVQRRYVLLSRWRAYDVGMNAYGLVPRMRWVVEEALWDRTDNRTLWHALRNVYTDDVYEGGRIWGMQIYLKRYFEYTLPSTLGNRGTVRNHAPVPDGRWISAGQMTAWQSDARAAIAFVNNHTSPGPRDLLRSKSIRIRAEAQAPYARGKVEWASEEWMRLEYPPEMALTPPMDYGSHALLEVPAGRYVIDPYDQQRGKPLELSLKAGELVVIELSRSLVGPDGSQVADLDTWRKAMARGRHAFLEDGRVLAQPWQVESWFVTR